MNYRKMLVIGILALAALVLAGCAGEAGPAGPAGPQGEQGPPGPSAVLTCSDCHNDETTLIAAQGQWAESGHGTGDSYARGTSSRCAGCHAGEGFTAMIDAGLTWDTVEAGVTSPTRQTCRTCHEIHTTFTGDDWALATTYAVTLVVSGETFDGGKGNLCANCHQPRSQIDEAVEGMIEVVEHWGPHHGVEAAMLLGVGGAGVEGSPAAHATMVADTCVGCHVGDTYNHTFEPSVAACTGCHADADDFDINGLQTEVEGLIAELGELLEAKGMMVDGEPVEGDGIFYPEADAAALWNYILIALEDGSNGVHNPAYIKALLEASLDALQ